MMRLCGVCREDVFKIPQVVSIGKAHQKSAAQIALRWLVQQNISAVTAAHNPAYIAEDIGPHHLACTACCPSKHLIVRRCALLLWRRHF
jgi:diketogulonate reductase-like aldo/keto reductase